MSETEFRVERLSYFHFALSFFCTVLVSQDSTSSLPKHPVSGLVRAMRSNKKGKKKAVPMGWMLLLDMTLFIISPWLYCRIGYHTWFARSSLLWGEAVTIQGEIMVYDVEQGLFQPFCKPLAVSDIRFLRASISMTRTRMLWPGWTTS